MLPTSITLELVAPDRQVLRESVESVQLPGIDGEFGILPGHAPLLTELGVGELSYLKAGQRYYATVIGGFAEVLGDRVIVLAEHSERAEELDLARARAARERAEKRLFPTPAPDVDFERAQNALRRARLRELVASQAATYAGGPTQKHGVN
jgi:F-type H+-transporting ATPase subunit epsilon